MLRRLRGHVFTVAPTLQHMLVPEQVPPSAPWHARLDDSLRGSVTIFGRLHEQPGADEVIVLVHGLGGTPDSYYVRRTASAVCAAGHSCLRLGLRGSARTGEDFYHAGLTADIHAAVASPALARYRRVVVIGFSMGGHATLRLAAEAHDPRVRAVVAICSPLDLAATRADLDRPRGLVYRTYLLRNLIQMYRVVYARHGGRVSLDEARGIDTFEAWDEFITAPRWGFAGAADYYRRASAAFVLDQLRVPALIVAEKHDPLVTARSLAPALSRSHPRLTVRWTDRGGHVGYPSNRYVLSLAGARTIESEVMHWLEQVE